MENSKITRLADFQSIALEELEKGNTDIAKDFMEDVLEELQEEVE